VLFVVFVVNSVWKSSFTTKDTKSTEGARRGNRKA
jgi:hypothetical protein